MNPNLWVIIYCFSEKKNYIYYLFIYNLFIHAHVSQKHHKIRQLKKNKKSIYIAKQATGHVIQSCCELPYTQSSPYKSTIQHEKAQYINLIRSPFPPKTKFIIFKFMHHFLVQHHPDPACLATAESVPVSWVLFGWILLTALNKPPPDCLAPDLPPKEVAFSSSISPFGSSASHKLQPFQNQLQTWRSTIRLIQFQFCIYIYFQIIFGE